MCTRSFVDISFHLFFQRFYFFLERGEGREKERERNINVREKYRSVSSHTCPNQGLNPQPRHVPWPGIDFLLWGSMPNQWSHKSQRYPDFFWVVPRNGIAESYDHSRFNILRICPTVFKVAALFYTPINNLGGFPFFSHSCQNLLLSYCLSFWL